MLAMEKVQNGQSGCKNDGDDPCAFWPDRATDVQSSLVRRNSIGLGPLPIAHKTRYSVTMAASVVRSGSQGFLTRNRVPGTAARLAGAQVPVPA